MKVLADTSVLVAAMVESHPRHARAFPWLRRAKGGDVKMAVAAHTLAELHAVLTTLPVSPRIGAQTARRLIRDDVESRSDVIELRRGDYLIVLDRMAELALSGGSIYDALIARAAEKANVAKLLTLNVADFRRVWPQGVGTIEEP